MYKYFKNIAEKSSCSLSGVCSIHPTTSALYEVLLYEIRETVFYLVKLKELDFVNKETQELCLRALSLFLINTSLNEKKYLDIVLRLEKTKQELKERYIRYCNDNELPCEILKTGIKINENTSVTRLIEFAQNISFGKSKVIDKSKQSLYELITFFAKLSAVISCKIKRYDESYNEFDYEILRFFALTNAYSIRVEKIKRRILEFCPVAQKLKEKLFSILENRYGKKENAVISTSEKKGHAILVSGDDLIELEKVLETVKKLKLEDKINVYTNGSLFLAHFYPYFKNNSLLKGHWGVNDAQYDFSKFPGTILITRNFLQKIDNLYKGDIYSSKVISFSKVIDIVQDDYEPVVKSAIANCGFLKENEKKILNINYNSDKIDEKINEIIDSETDDVVIVAGHLDFKNILEEYKNKKILHFSTPIESDLFLQSINRLILKKIKLTIFFSHCDIESLFNLLLLLDKNIKIYISDCSHIIINPHIIEALKDYFDISIIE